MSQTGPTDTEPSPAAVQLGFNLPTFYMNAFTNNATLTDMTTLALWGPRPQALLTMPLPVAKSYANQILRLIGEVENQTKQRVLSLEEMQPGQERSSADGGS